MSKYSPRLFVDELLDGALDVAVQLALGLAFELRLRQLHGDHGDQPFAHVVAGDGDFVLLLLEHAGGDAKLLMERVSAERKPERCVPPSTVLMVLANAKTFSV